MIASGALPPHRIALVAPGRAQRVVLGLAAVRGGARPRRAARRRRRGRRARAPGGDRRLARRAGDAARPAPASRHVRRRCSCSPAASSRPSTTSRSAGFPRWARVDRVRRARCSRAAAARAPAPAVLTCGAGEENIHNNREMAAALAAGRPLHELARPAQLHGLAGRAAPAPDRAAGGRCGRRTPRRAVLPGDRRAAATSSPTATGAGRSSPSRPSAATPGSTATAAWSARCRGLIDAGRAKLYCVDSFDGASWSNSSLPLEERARAHERYESWILDQVVPWIHARLRRPAGDRHARRQPRRLPRRQHRAAARGRVPARARLLGQLRPRDLGRLGRARRRRLLQQPVRLARPRAAATTWTGCARG